MSLVSVCIPTFNYGRFIGEAIESVLTQEYCELEVLVVDDASTDDTEGIVRQWVQRDSRVHYRRNPVNLGFAGNARECTRDAQGDLLWVFQSDDICTDTRFLSRAVEAFAKTPSLAFFYSAFRLVDQERQLLTEIVPQAHDALLTGRQALYRILHTQCWPSATVMAAPAFHRVGGYLEEIGMGNDVYTYLSLCLQGDVSYCATMMVSARVHAVSNTGAMGDHRFSTFDAPLARFEADIAHDQELVALVQSVRRAFATPHSTKLRCPEHLCPVVARLVDKWNMQGVRVVIYGASMHTAQLFEWTNLSEASIVAIADRDTTLHGSRLHGYPVIPATDVTKTGAEIILVSSQRYQEEICAELAQIPGLPGTFEIETLYPRVSRTWHQARTEEGGNVN